MIKVIDSIMGSGKSTWIIKHINAFPDQQYLIVVPYLSEIERYNEALNKIRIYNPQHRHKTKLEDFKSLVANGYNIVTTHSLIRNIDNECLEYLKVQNYTLVLDESLNVLDKYPIDPSDLKIIINNQYITVGKDEVVEWNNNNPDASEYNGDWIKNLKRHIEKKSIVAYRDNDNQIAQLFWRYPPEFFKTFQEAFILTYLWEGSIQEAFFDLYNIEYDHLSLAGNELRPYTLSEDLISRKKYKPLINILDDQKLNLIGTKIRKGKNPLSNSWYESNKNSTYIKILKNHLYNFFHNKIKTSMKDNMWTCFKDYQNKLKGKGYTGSSKNPCFVPFNTKGCNDFSHKKSLAFMVNIYVDPNIINFFAKHGISISQENYATSVLVQWIWRSQIRKEKPINLYVPSDRMRKLLEKFFTG